MVRGIEVRHHNKAFYRGVRGVFYAAACWPKTMPDKEMMLGRWICDLAFRGEVGGMMTTDLQSFIHE